MDQIQPIKKILETTQTIAVVGFSSREERAGFYVPEYLQNQGFHIVPVNPKFEEALGEKAYPDLSSVPKSVDLVLIFQRSEKVLPFVEQAIEIGATAVWMQLGIHNKEAATKANSAGLDVVMNACMLGEHQRHQQLKLSTKASV